MACGVLPPGLQDLLLDFDVHREVPEGTLASPMLWNLLLGDLHLEVAGLRATILKGGFLQAHDLGHTTRPVPPIEMTAQKVYIQFPNPQSLKSTKELLLTRLFLHPHQEQTHRSELVLCMSKDSLIVPRHHGNPEVMVHLFAGGYGGWTSALRYYQPKIYPNVRSISVEIDRKLAFQHALTHNESFSPSDVKLPLGLLDKLSGNVMVCADVASSGWQLILTGASSKLWTLSPPCQPWSSAGRAQGLEDARAQSLPKAFAAARFHQPPLLLFENVKGFRQHPQYPVFGQLLSWAGYQIFHENVIELAEICPIRRPRYLAILVRRDISWNDLPSWQPWRDFTFSTPLNFDCWSPTQPNEVDDFFPSEATKNFYMTAELCPTRGEQPISTHRVFQTRVPGLHVKQPVLMAKYGEQHLLDINFLLDKGLHGFFCPDQMTFRWWKPVDASTTAGLSAFSASGACLAQPG